MNSDKPLVSLCITCYNQEKYIREAVQSAFDQTYSPLEIIICDDCSKDRTPEIIEEMIADYRAHGGKHSVVFKRNEKTLNVIFNYMQAFKMGRGELLVTGSGDDVSVPSRVALIVREWIKAEKIPTEIIHGRDNIDTNGNIVGEEGPRPPIEPLGACMAYRRDVITAFPDPVIGNAYEDMIYGARAYIMGEPLRLQDHLLKYRIGGTTSGFGEDRKRWFAAVKREFDSHEQLEMDFAYAKGKWSDERVEMVASADRARRDRTLLRYQHEIKLSTQVKRRFLRLAGVVCNLIHIHPMRMLRRLRCR